MNHDPNAPLLLLHRPQNAVRDKIALSQKGGPGNERRNELRTELESIRGQQSMSKASRGKVRDQLTSIQDSINKKVCISIRRY